MLDFQLTLLINHYLKEKVQVDILGILGNIFKTIINTLPWLIGLIGFHSWLYVKSPRYYFFIMKRLSKRKDTNWEITVSFSIKRDAEFFKELERVIRDTFGSYNRRFNLKNKKHYNFGNFSCTVFHDIDFVQEDVVSVEFLFDPLNVTLINAKERLKELRLLFNELEKALPIEHKHYNTNIKFTSMKNPFYGLMIQRLGEEHINYFECEFPLSLLLKKHDVQNEDTKNNIRVFKDKITITETRFDIMEEAIIESLLLR